MNANIIMIKPNLAELSKLCGVESIFVLELESLDQTFVNEDSVEVLVLTKGAKGALLATKDVKYHAIESTFKKYYKYRRQYSGQYAARSSLRQIIWRNCTVRDGLLHGRHSVTPHTAL